MARFPVALRFSLLPVHNDEDCLLLSGGIEVNRMVVWLKSRKKYFSVAEDGEVAALLDGEPLFENATRPFMKEIGLADKV
jgi:hypothetical protein